MSTPTEQAIQTQLARLLRGELSFDAFWDWLRPLQRTVPGTDPARKLLFRIIARLDEYDYGVMTDDQLWNHLLALLPGETRQTVERHRGVASPGNMAATNQDGRDATAVGADKAGAE